MLVQPVALRVVSTRQVLTRTKDQADAAASVAGQRFGDQVRILRRAGSAFSPKQSGDAQ
jgi:hypothetical protein